MEWEFIVSIGVNIINYPLIFVDTPTRIGENLTSNVSSVIGYFQLLEEVQFELNLPDRDYSVILNPSFFYLYEPRDDNNGSGSDLNYSNQPPIYIVMKGNVSLSVIDNDFNGYFTATDVIRIKGIEVNEPYTLIIYSGQFGLTKIYEIEGSG